MSLVDAIEVLCGIVAVGFFYKSHAIKRGNYSDFWYWACLENNPVAPLNIFGIICCVIFAALVVGDALFF